MTGLWQTLVSIVCGSSRAPHLMYLLHSPTLMAATGLNLKPLPDLRVIPVHRVHKGVPEPRAPPGLPGLRDLPDQKEILEIPDLPDPRVPLVRRVL